MEDEAHLKQILAEAQAALKERLVNGIQRNEPALMLRLFEAGKGFGLTERQICLSLLEPLRPLLRTT